MPAPTFSAQINSRYVVVMDYGSATVNVTATVANGVMTLAYTGASSSGSVQVLVPSGFAGMNVPANMTLNISTTLANSRAFSGDGSVVAIASTTQPEDLNALNLYVDVIQLTSGLNYTINAAQAAMARVGVAGALGNLASTGVITLVASTGTDLSTLVTDQNDVIVLTGTANYTLTAAQAKTAKIGTTGVLGTLGGTGIMTVLAATASDLSSIKTDSNDILVLTAGQDYVLTSAQTAIARVGSGNQGQLVTAGAITAIASSSGEDLTALKATGVDIWQLTAGQAYTLTAQQAALARVGGTGAVANLASAGVITIKADQAANLSAIVIDANDVIQLAANQDYTLTSMQASKAKVGVGGTAGVLSAAGMITVKAGTTGENLTSIAATGIEAYELTAGQDYVLTSTQAGQARVGSAGSNGDFSTAGNITLLGSASGEDLSSLDSPSFQGIDVIQLTVGQAYTLTATQARTAKVGASGTLGNVTSAGVITLKAPMGGDLTSIVTDANDLLILGTGQNYVLTSVQASTAKVGSAGILGALNKAGDVTVKANVLGEDLSLMNFVGADYIELTPNQKYTLTSAQAQASRVGPSGLRGALDTAGTITVKALATGEDLTQLACSGVDVIQLTAGVNYVLGWEQAKMARMGATGVSGNLVSTGVLTLLASDVSANLSSLVTDANDSIVLGLGRTYTLTSSQAAVAKVGGAGLPGVLVGVTATILAPVSADLSGLSTDSQHSFKLGNGQSYTLTAAQAAAATIDSAAAGDLGKAGVVTLKASVTGEDLTLPSYSSIKGVDQILLTAGQAYTLTGNQAAIAKMSLAGAMGNLTGAGVVTVKANVGADLSGLVTDSNDSLVLTAGQAYTLTSAQVLIARVNNNGIVGIVGNLNDAGFITLKASVAGEDLTLLSQNISGVDAYTLTAGVAYSLTATQALLSRMGGAGAVGNLTSAGAITLMAGSTSDLTSITLDGGDTLVLNSGQDYTMTAAQALRAKVGSAGVLGQLTTTGKLAIIASTGIDLSTLQIDSGDELYLTAGQKYTLSTAQAAVARVGVPGNSSLAGDVSLAGNIKLIASATGEDLSNLTSIGYDAIQLTTGQAYKLSAAQAAIAQIGATGTVGNLSSAGVLTVVASAAADLSTLVLDAGDRIELGVGQNYTLTSAQAAVARVGSTGTLGDLASAGVVTIKANAAGEDLSALAAAITPGSIDRVILATGKNYTLTTEMARGASVGVGAIGDMSKAGVITVKGAATGEDLTALTQTQGVDAIQLATAVNYTLTPALAGLSKMGTSTVAGNLVSAGTITLNALTSADLSAFVMDSGDLVFLGAGQDYTLTSVEAADASVYTSGSSSYSVKGNLTSAGFVTLKTSAMGEDISNLAATGLDSVVLTAGQNYTITPVQAAVAKVGATGVVGDLTKAGIVTVKASVSGQDISAMTANGVDVYQLTSGQAYTLTATQASLSKMGSSTTAGILVSQGALTVKAGAVSDLSKLTLDANDQLILSTGVDYTLNAMEARIAQVYYTQTQVNNQVTEVLTSPGALGMAKTVTVKANAAGEDLSAMVVSGLSQIVLAAGQNYTLRSEHLNVARVGTGTMGDLTKAASLTVLAPTAGGTIPSTYVATGVDVVQLTAANATAVPYTFSGGTSGLRFQVGASNSSSYTALTFRAATDTDASDGVIGATGVGLVNAVDQAGEWTFNTSTKLLTAWDGVSAVKVSLTGINNILANGGTDLLLA